MTDPMPTVRSLDDAPSYEQNEPGEAYFNMLINKGEIPGIQMGHVHLKGSIHKTPGAHDEFHQSYFLYEGSGTIHIGDKTKNVQAPTVVIIPKNTTHSVEVAGNKELRYIYVNQYS